MALATEKQKSKLKELGIVFCENITIEEAREELLSQNEKAKQVSRVTVKDIKNEALLENSDWED